VGTILIGLGELAVTKTPGDTIRTLGLGSCVAVVLSHGPTGAIGMVHVVLPESSTNLQKARDLPGYFADTGIDALLARMNEATHSQGRYLVKMAGGAAVLTNGNGTLTDNMNIGKRNIVAVKRALWKKGLGAIAEDVGGENSRSVSIEQGHTAVEIRLGSALVKTL
jgi:chemotaxis protein CheD